MRKTHIVCLLAVLLMLVATSSAQTDTKAKTKTESHPKTQKAEDTLDSFQAIEKGLWEAWKNRDAKPFEQQFAPDAITIDDGGLSDRAAVLKVIAGCDVKNYSLGDFKLTKVDADAALLTYKASNVDATCGGQKSPQSVFASTLFKKSGGAWRVLFHQETTAATTPTDLRNIP